MWPSLTRSSRVPPAARSAGWLVKVEHEGCLQVRRRVGCIAPVLAAAQAGPAKIRQPGRARAGVHRAQRIVEAPTQGFDLGDEVVAVQRVGEDVLRRSDVERVAVVLQLFGCLTRLAIMQQRRRRVVDRLGELGSVVRSEPAEARK